MKGDYLIVVEKLVKEDGAVLRCLTCHGYDIRAFDERAERMAYARATNAWKDGAFDGRMGREDVLRLVREVLEASSRCCRACSAT